MSTPRRCEIVKDQKSDWNLIIGKFEHAEELSDCNIYGPFKSEEQAEEYLFDNFSNPGCISTDDSGTRSFPNRIRPDFNNQFTFSSRRF